MTEANTTTAPTPEELAALVGWPHETGMRLCGEKDIAAAIRQHSEALEALVAELTAENERVGKLLTADLSLLRMGPSELGFTLDAAGRAVAIIAGHLATWLEAHHAENYTETAFEQIDISGGARSYTLTVQRGEGKSPHQLRKEAEARATTAEAALAASQEREKALREALERLESANDVLCATRSEKAYASMLEDGASDALLALDDARREARAALQPQEPHHDR